MNDLITVSEAKQVDHAIIKSIQILKRKLKISFEPFDPDQENTHKIHREYIQSMQDLPALIEKIKIK